MMFDGQKFAAEVEAQLRIEIAKLPRKLKLAVWLDPANRSGAKYVEKKMEVAKRLGVEIVLNETHGDEDGVMVQLPHPDSQRLIANIDPKKDVDGLRGDSAFQPATVRAVVAIIEEAKARGKSGIIVGSKGEVGKRLVKALGWKGMDKEDFDPVVLKQAEVVISATGQEGLIKLDMVRDGVVAIDVGFPKGDFEASVANKAVFFTPVPGGVGPVTVVMLFMNLLESSK